MRRIFLAALVLLVAACGNPAPEDSAAPTTARRPDAATLGPEAPASGSPHDTPDTVPEPSASPATPKGGTVNPRKVPWTSAEPVGDGRTIRVVWTSGVEPCATLDRVEVDEGRDQVTVTLYEGPSRASPDAVCIEIAINKVTEVRLKRPLGDRRIVDGAR
ncbi:MAG: hypothetical protein DIU60_021655 [Actinomycetes bacterium]|jgi:hypothetical protein|nr:MAG: hypothetical protein DIU60_11925 [Actinomycetota bacterium]